MRKVKKEKSEKYEKYEKSEKSEKWKKWKLKVMMNKSLNVNKLLAREVHVDDSELDTWGARVVLRNLSMILYVPKFLDVDRISIAVVLERKWKTTYRLNLVSLSD